MAANDSSERFLLNCISYEDNAWYIANIGLSNHEGVENMAGAGTRGVCIQPSHAHVFEQ